MKRFVAGLPVFVRGREPVCAKQHAIVGQFAGRRRWRRRSRRARGHGLSLLFSLPALFRHFPRRLDIRRYLDHARRQEPSVGERAIGDDPGLACSSGGTDRPPGHPAKRDAGRMSQLQEEAHRRQRRLPALRPAVTKRRSLGIIWIAAVARRSSATCDWTRPPRQQISVALYQRIVIGGYRVLLKPLSDRFVRCRYQPTCSQYSEEAMLTHGFPKGLWLTTARLFRCMPWVPVGTRDPVPP